MCMSPSLRPLTCLDARAVRELFLEIFDECEDERYAQSWRQRVPSLSYGYFSAEGVLLGFALVANVAHGYYLNYICVSPEAQGKSIGSQILLTILMKLKDRRKSLYLVPVNNAKTIRWYKKIGFYVSHEWKATGGEKALYMARHAFNTRTCPSL